MFGLVVLKLAEGVKLLIIWYALHAVKPVYHSHTEHQNCTGLTVYTHMRPAMQPPVLTPNIC